MPVATALVSGNDPIPQLAERAVQQALTRAGLAQANAVMLFLTPEYARHAQPAVAAAARAARCIQVAGGIASGVFTESGWVLDRPAAVAMVLGGEFSLAPGEGASGLLLSYATGNVPTHWSATGKRFGATFAGSFAGTAAPTDPAAWEHGRLTESSACCIKLLGADISVGVSSGLRLLGKAKRVEQSSGYDLERIGGQIALKTLARAAPGELRENLGRQLHHLAAVLFDEDAGGRNELREGHYRALALLAANPDGSLTLSEQVTPGQSLAWAVRQPLAAEADMRSTIDQLTARSGHEPACALMFSCIGRGPYFYGGEDRDLRAMTERFPGLPILGVYGTGQITPAVPGVASENKHVQNTVVTALVRRTLKVVHVQPLA